MVLFILSVRMSVSLVRFFPDFFKIDVLSFVVVKEFLFASRVLLLLFLFPVLGVTAVVLSTERVVVLLLAWVHFPENAEKTADNLAHSYQYCNEQCNDKRE